MARDLIRRGTRERQRLADDLQLGSLRPPSDLLDRVAVTVSRLEIHARINGGGIFGELHIHSADRFEKLLPLDLHEPAATTDHIRERSLLHHLAAVLVFGLLWLPFVLVLMALKLVGTLILLPVVLVMTLVGLLVGGLVFSLGLLLPLAPIALLVLFVWTLVGLCRPRLHPLS